MWCLAADTHLATGKCSLWCQISSLGGHECKITHRRPLAVLRMLFKIRCNPSFSALPVPYVTVRVTSGALIAHRCTYTAPRYRTFCTAGLLFSTIYLRIKLIRVGLVGFRSSAIVFLLTKVVRLIFVS